MASFKTAFAAARKELGAGKTFTWQGKSYTTDLASDGTATRPKARPASKAAIPAKDKVTTPTVSPRPRSAVSGVAAAKPKTDTVARDMLNKNIVKATGDKLAADRAKPAVKMPARPISKTPVKKAEAGMTRQERKKAGLPVSALGRLVAKISKGNPNPNRNSPKKK